MIRNVMKSAVLAAATAIFAAGSANAEQVVLKFWDNQRAESDFNQNQQNALKRFEKENPEIKVELTTIPYSEYQQRLLTAVQGGNAPDVATLDQIWMGAFAQAGAITALDDQVKTSGLTADTFFKGAWDSNVSDGRLWGIPINVDVWSFTYYNKALLKEAGVDPASLKTFEGLKAAAPKLTDKSKGRYAIGLFGHKGEDTVVVLNTFIFSNGGKVLDEKGKCALTSPEAVGALSYLQSLVPYAPQGIMNASSATMRELFLNGSLATEFWPALEQPTLQKSKIDWDFVVGNAPEGKTAIGTYGGWNLAIFEASQHKEAAWKLIQFLTREDVNGDVVELVPANMKAAKSFLAANRKGADLIIPHLENASPRPLSPRYLEVADIEVTLAQNVFSGMDPQKAAGKACTAIDALN
ncbi:sugar ABC transporter substrate-binding protein [Mesorhizobium sp.]|uniref:ABC transporter substrate-binding protein n=1 Tax=Mesorhizobium sp. TaxID=1871066 RepID=UPI00257C6566|nr:sugar ABC transporter substrate-binding protein [Mesorhizobium sp.]